MRVEVVCERAGNLPFLAALFRPFFFTFFPRRSRWHCWFWRCAGDDERKTSDCPRRTANATGECVQEHGRDEDPVSWQAKITRRLASAEIGGRPLPNGGWPMSPPGFFVAGEQPPVKQGEDASRTVSKNATGESPPKTQRTAADRADAPPQGAHAL